MSEEERKDENGPQEQRALAVKQNQDHGHAPCRHTHMHTGKHTPLTDTHARADIYHIQAHTNINIYHVQTHMHEETHTYTGMCINLTEVRDTKHALAM